MAEPTREYPQAPIACAAAIVMQGDTVLLIQRGREPNYGEWSFPGGVIELGETSKECAIREALEETGLKIEILDVVTVVDREFRDVQEKIQYQYLIVDYLAEPVEGTLHASGDVLQAQWVPFDQAHLYRLAPPTGEVLEKAVFLWHHYRTLQASA
jgi:ADP-ribose pyrophosphatase YjhB (NUDIX family)